MNTTILILTITVLLTTAIIMVVDTLGSNNEQQPQALKPMGIEVRNKEFEPRLNVPKVPYDTLIKILNDTIAKELYFWGATDLALKQVKIIEVEETLTDLSIRIDRALSDNIIYDLSYYHTEGWINNYIVKSVRIYIFDYIQSHPI